MGALCCRLGKDSVTVDPFMPPPPQASPVSTIITTGQRTMAPRRIPGTPPPHLSFLQSLPDPAHDSIASFLSSNDMHQMMATSAWLMDAYGGRAESLALIFNIRRWAILASQLLLLHRVFVKHMNSRVASMLHRRPYLNSLHILTWEPILAVVEAMRAGQGQSLQALEVSPCSGMEDYGALGTLMGVLADGLCPKLNSLHFALMDPRRVDAVMALLGEAMRVRVDKGGSGLRVLRVTRRCYRHGPARIVDLSVLSSGACEALEDLILEGYLCLESGEQALADWLLRTKGRELRSLSLVLSSDIAMDALCRGGIAPQLTSLMLYGCQPLFLDHLSSAIGGGSWPELRHLCIAPMGEASVYMPLTLIESISTQATGLMSLLLHGRCITSVHAIFLGQSLQGGALPRLQLLGLNHTAIGDTGMVELARSLGEGGAPCSASLQDFWGNDCRVGPHGVRALVGAMRTYGACRHLQSLSLNKNRVGDQGVGYLAQGFEAGTFPALQILSLEKVHMSEEAARVLCRAVVHHCTHKIKLYLKGNHVRKDLWEEVM